jgi:hypothetical protein
MKHFILEMSQKKTTKKEAIQALSLVSLLSENYSRQVANHYNFARMTLDPH